MSTTRPDGRPHAMPIWGLWIDGTFLFSTSRRSRKGRNLSRREGDFPKSATRWTF